MRLKDPRDRAVSAHCLAATYKVVALAACSFFAHANVSASIQNEWSFDLDSNGSDLLQAINSGSSLDTWNSAKPGFSIEKGRLLGEHSADSANGESRFNSGYFATSTYATPQTAENYLRADLSYDFSSPSNDTGSIAMVAFRDNNNKTWGFRLHYNVSSGTVYLQSSLAGTWQNLESVPMAGSISAVIAINPSTDTFDLYLDLDGDGDILSVPSYTYQNAGITGKTLVDTRLQLTGDLYATSAPAVAVEHIRHCDTLAEASAEISYLHRLSPTEAELIESDLGILISDTNSEQLAAIVKAPFPEQWRSDSDIRIETYRKADLEVQISDTYGRPVLGADIDFELERHDFVFGGVLRAKHWAGDEDDVTPESYKENALKFFNCFGLQNSLKPKLQSGHLQYLEPFFTWADTNDIPVRGHSLLWPGNPNNNHLTTTVRALLDACHAATPEELDAAKTALEAGINAEIADWASRWDVYEWDVMNEPVSNHELQDMLGDDKIADWFTTAKNNAVDPNAGMLVNDFQIISAPSTVLGWPENTYDSRSGDYKAILDQMIADSTPLDAIGFQSRFGWERTAPDLLYQRLEEYAAYGLPMAGTEFEVKPRAYDAGLDYEFTPTPYLRAQITGEVLRTYFSHPSVYAFNAWTFYHDEHGLFQFDGTPKLNALVWYYMTQLQWHTSENTQTDSDGQTALRGFLGTYNLSVTHAGHEYSSEFFLGEDDSIELIIAVDSDGDDQLDDVDPDDDNDGYDDTIDLYPTDSSRWNDAPTWTHEPFTLADANENVDYFKWINWIVEDVDTESSALTFAGVSNVPGWMTVSTNGNLSGQPGANDVGTFSFVVSVSDGFNAPVNTSLTITVVAAPPEWSLRLYEGFENGFEYFTGDGNDGRLYKNGTYAQDGDNAGLIRDDGDSAVIEQIAAIDASNLLEIEVKFQFYAASMENDEDFWLQYWDGNAWVTLKAYIHQVDFQNDGFYAASFNLDPVSHNLGSDFKIRFRCDASGNGDRIYIDQIEILGLE